MLVFLVHTRVSFFFFLQPEKSDFFCGLSQEILGWRAGLDAVSIVWLLTHCTH